MVLFQKPGEFGGDARLFATLQLEQHVLLGGEMKVEGAVRDTGGGNDRTHIGSRHARTLELGYRGAKDPLTRLQPARLAGGVLDLRRHRVICSPVADLSQWQVRSGDRRCARYR